MHCHSGTIAGLRRPARAKGNLPPRSAADVPRGPTVRGQAGEISIQVRSIIVQQGKIDAGVWGSKGFEGHGWCRGDWHGLGAGGAAGLLCWVEVGLLLRPVEASAARHDFAPMVRQLTGCVPDLIRSSGAPAQEVRDRLRALRRSDDPDELPVARWGSAAIRAGELFEVTACGEMTTPVRIQVEHVTPDDLVRSCARRADPKPGGDVAQRLHRPLPRIRSRISRR